tara:strand:- start:345 stop:1418 length:1074 start_codon:yes stop_codon:yes gene_type:complete
MNDLIIMSIKGGRYIEAENQCNQLVLNEPNTENYFLLGSIKSNLLFGKGRDFSEIIHCFEKALELTKDKKQTRNDIGAFLFGICKQIKPIEATLKKEVKNKAIKSLMGLAITYFSSSIIDDAKNSFGVITGIVGASFGIGMSIEGLSEIGDLGKQLEYVKDLNLKIQEHLLNNFPEVSDKFIGKVHVNKLKEIQKKFPEEIYDFNEIGEVKKAFTKYSERFKDWGITGDNALFGLIWHHQSYVVIFYEDHLKAISNIGLSDKWVKLDYSNIVDIHIDEKINSYYSGLPAIVFKKGTEFIINGEQNELTNFTLGGEDKMSRDNNIHLKKVKTGFFKNHDYSGAREFFTSCFESAEINS